MFNCNLGWTCVDVYIIVDIHFHNRFQGESFPVSCKHPLRFKMISSFLSFYSAQPQGQEWTLINSKLAYETENGSEPFDPQYPPKNSPDSSAYISFKELVQWENLIKDQSIFPDHFITSHYLSSGWCKGHVT